MIEVSDYIFYRFCKFYAKTGRKKEVISYASALTAAVQVLTILSLITLLSLFINLPFPKMYIIVIVGVFFLGLNWYRYENQVDFEAFEKRWSEQEAQDRVYKGYLIAAYTSFVVLFPIVIGYLRHNLGLIN